MATWSHGRISVAEEVGIAQTLLLADFRFQMAGVECACVRDDVGGSGRHVGTLVADAVFAAVWQSRRRQLRRRGRQLCKLRQRRTVAAASNVNINAA